MTASRPCLPDRIAFQHLPVERSIEPIIRQILSDFNRIRIDQPALEKVLPRIAESVEITWVGMLTTTGRRESR
jgi:hypothetical protein